MKALNRYQCWIKGLWRSIWTLMGSGYPMSGHNLVEEGTYNNCKVVVCRCEVCGKLDISWSKN